MRKTIRRLLTIALIGGLIYGAVVVFMLIAMNVSFPSSEMLAHWYLDEIVNGTAEMLKTPYLRCGSRFVRFDRALYGGAEIRNVQVQAVSGTGSSDTLDVLTVTFEYRLQGAADWQMDTLTHLITDFEPLHARRLWCSG